MLGFLNASMAVATQRFMSYSEGEGDAEKQKKIFNVGILMHLAIALIMILTLVILAFVFLACYPFLLAVNTQHIAFMLPLLSARFSP